MARMPVTCLEDIWNAAGLIQGRIGEVKPYGKDAEEEAKALIEDLEVMTKELTESIKSFDRIMRAWQKIEAGTDKDYDKVKK